MKKLYTAAALALLFAVLAIGLWTVTREKSLQADAVKAHTQMAAHFPCKESLSSLNTAMNGFYKFSAFAPQEGIQLVIPVHNDAANGGATLAPSDVTEASEESEENTQSTSEAESSEPTETTQESTEAMQEPEVETLGQMLLIGNRAVELPRTNYDVIHNYAQTVTRIAEALENVQTYSILVPNSAEFYTPKAYHTGEYSQKDMIDYAYSVMGAPVTTVDAYAALEAHRDEEIYFRTDHHWTQRGAYYAYGALCETLGYVKQPLHNFEQGQYDVFLGSMYSFLSGYPQREILRQDPDTLTYYKPFREVKARYYEDASLSYAGTTAAIVQLGSGTSNRYLCYLGGDHPVTILETDVVDGGVCLLLKESYGNAFAPWLTSHYSKIICIDPREFNRNGKPSLDLAAFAEKMEVDDCIILNYPMMLNSDAYVQWLGRLVK